MSDLESKKCFKVKGFNYNFYQDYTVKYELVNVYYKTCDNFEFDCEIEALSHVDRLLSDRKRYNEIVKNNLLTEDEIESLFNNHNVLKNTPKVIKHVEKFEDYRYNLYSGDELIGGFRNLCDLGSYFKYDAGYEMSDLHLVLGDCDE
jgi:hypothetical protein